MRHRRRERRRAGPRLRGDHFAIDTTDSGLRHTMCAPGTHACVLAAEDPNALMLILPSDHKIDESNAFHNAIKTAAALAKDGTLVTFGIKPTRPETGNG